MATTIVDERLQRLEAVEALEVAVYRAALTWAPVGQKARDAKVKGAAAEVQLSAAQAGFNEALRAVGQRDRVLGDELARLHAADRLTRENIGDGGGSLIDGILASAATLRKSREAVASVQSSVGQAESAVLWRDVLVAAAALRGQASEAVRRSAALMFGADDFPVAPPNDAAAAIAERCKARLQEMGVKA